MRHELRMGVIKVMFPRVKRVPHSRYDEATVKFYDMEQSIEFDQCKCIGCGICIKSCPNQVIHNPSTEGKIRITKEDLVPSIPNPTDCSFCGTCSYLCPVGAIWLKKDNKYVKRKDLPVYNKNIVPKLEYDVVELTNPKPEAKTFIDGEIKIDWNKCISCMSCVNNCPTDCFTKQKSQEDNTKKKTKPTFDGENCIKCGTCVRSCSQNAITLEVHEIKHNGNYKEIFWNPLISRLKSY